MKKYSLKAIAALFLVVIMCLSFIPAAFAAADPESCGHNNQYVTKTNKEEPQCETDGCKEYWYCSNCETYFSDEALTKIIADLAIWKATEGDDGGKLAALGHVFSGEVDKSKSDANGHYYKCVHEGCTATGSGTTPNKPEDHTFINHVCSVCDYVEQCKVTFDGDNDKITNKDTTVDAGKENYSVTITPKDGYTAKITVVKMGGAVLPIEEPAEPKAKSNYELSDDGKTIKFKVSITGDVEITVEAKGIEYDVTFELDGGSWPAGYSPKTTKHTYGTSTQIIDEDPTKAGYTFKGWKVNSNTEPETEKAIPADTAPGNVTLTAAWEEKTVGITVVNGKTKGNVTTIKTRERLEITADDISGKVFKRWTVTAPTGEEFAGQVTITSGTASPAKVSVDATFTDAGNPLEITAEYNATVTYNYTKSDNTPGTQNGGDYAKGAKITLIDCPDAPADKAFKCWELGGTTYEAGEEYTMGEDGVTFVAQYVDKTFEVTPAYLEFAAYEGDTKAPAFKTVSIKNTGDSPVTVTLPASTDKYIVRDLNTDPITSNPVTLEAGETYKIKVRPADPADKYKEDDSFIDYLTIANDAGQKEKVGILFEVTKPLKVSISPETLEKNCGESASFTAKASGGSGSYKYQWQMKLPGKDSYTDLYDGQKLCAASTSDCTCVVSGAKSRTLTLDYAVCKVDGYKFRCVVTDAEDNDNTVTSGGASLRVKIRGQKEYDKYNYQCTHCGEISPKIKTGDESMPILWASLAGVSLVALTVGAVYYFRKKKKNT